MLWCWCFFVTSISAVERTRTKNSNIIKSTENANSERKREPSKLLWLWSMNKKSIVRRPLQGEEERKIGNVRFHPSILEENLPSRWSHRSFASFLLICKNVLFLLETLKSFMKRTFSGNYKVMYAHCSNLFRCLRSTPSCLNSEAWLELLWVESFQRRFGFSTNAEFMIDFHGSVCPRRQIKLKFLFWCDRKSSKLCSHFTQFHYTHLPGAG